jgi:hypothetical protein
MKQVTGAKPLQVQQDVEPDLVTRPHHKRRMIRTPNTPPGITGRGLEMVLSTSRKDSISAAKQAMIQVAIKHVTRIKAEVVSQFEI